MMHRIHAVQWYRRERMSEQDEGADLQTRQREADGQGLNDPRLHRPQQVSILVGLVGEEASMSMLRGGARR